MNQTSPGWITFLIPRTWGIWVCVIGSDGRIRSA